MPAALASIAAMRAARSMPSMSHVAASASGIGKVLKKTVTAVTLSDGTVYFFELMDKNRLDDILLSKEG